MLIDTHEIWVGVSRVKEFEEIPRTAARYDRVKLEDTPEQHKISALFGDKTGIEIAASCTPVHPIAYHALLSKMDIAVKAGFIDLGITDPRGWSAQLMP